MIIRCNISSKISIRAEAKTIMPIKVSFSGTHIHTNKLILDGITEALISSWNNAVSLGHQHDNKDILDSIDQIIFDSRNDASDQAHTHSNYDIINAITQSDIDNWNQKANAIHTHDTRYYTKDEIIQQLAGKSNTDHTHQDYAQQIQNILQILASDDTTLDEIQEIVNYIKQNKEILDTLSISNIAGLEEALGNKTSIGHGHNIGDVEYLQQNLDEIKQIAIDESFISSLLFG